MCGIFLIINKTTIDKSRIKKLGALSMRRGKDSSGLLFYQNGIYQVVKADQSLVKTIQETNIVNSCVVLGHSRLITNGQNDNQPVVGSQSYLLHNGIIVNESEGWSLVGRKPSLSIDSEVLIAIIEKKHNEGMTVEEAIKFALGNLKGTISAIVAIPKQGKIYAFSNNGSLYYSNSNGEIAIASEMVFLKKMGHKEITKIINDVQVIDIPISNAEIKIFEKKVNRVNILPNLGQINSEERVLESRRPLVRRCSCCVLPETMPFIRFNDKGVCNYCQNYKPLIKSKPRSELYNLIYPYIGQSGYDCIVPFSGT